MTTISITESNILTALRSFLLGILPAGTEVIRARDNRVAEPEGVNFVEMTPIMDGRLATNQDSYQDIAGIGSITGAAMTITQMIIGAFAAGQTVTGQGVAAGTTITGFGTATGGVGTYTISPPQTVASETIQAGSVASEQDTEVTVQLDFHGPAGADNARTTTTLFRSDYAVEQFVASGFDVAPLYTSDPRKVPFINGEQQFETVTTLDAVMQANPVVSVPAQFASEIDIGIVNTNAAYPPA